MNKKTIARNVEAFQRTNTEAGYSVCVSGTYTVSKMPFMPSFSMAEAMKQLNEALKVLQRLPRRWSYMVTASSIGGPRIYITVKPEKFKSWLEKHSLNYTDEVQWVTWESKPGGFWSHRIMVKVNSVELVLCYNE